jgi:hypothetical protein
VEILRVTQDEYSLLCRTVPSGSNSITIEVDSYDFQTAVDLCMKQMLRYAGLESKTSIKRQKLPEGEYHHFWIGGRTVGWAAMIRHAWVWGDHKFLAEKQWAANDYIPTFRDQTYKPPVGYAKRSRLIQAIDPQLSNLQKLEKYSEII